MDGDTKLLGASVNGVVRALLDRETLLADFPRSRELDGIADGDYCPLSLYLDLCDHLEARLGVYAFLRVGRRMAVTVMDTAFPRHLESVEAAIAAIETAHRVFCRPVVGAFELVVRTPGRLAVRYTAPYNCTLQEGLFYEVALRYGASGATVTHAECRRRGAEACRFELVY